MIGYSSIGNIIESSKKSADKQSIGNFAKSIEQDYLTYKMLKNDKPPYVHSILQKESYYYLYIHKNFGLHIMKTGEDGVPTWAKFDFDAYSGGEKVYCGDGRITIDGKVSLECCYVGNSSRKKFNYTNNKVEDAQDNCLNNYMD